MRTRQIGCIGALFLTCAAGWAATIYVVAPGTPGVVPGTPYHTWTNAATNIATAVIYASSGGGDTVLVSNGTYRITSAISIGKPVVVRSLAGAAATLVDGQYPAYSNRVFEIYHPDAVVDGFTITGGGISSDGGGVYILTAGGTIQNCSIVSNRAGTGGGMQLYGGGGKASVINCLIGYNNAGTGGGIRIRGTNCFIIDSTVLSNQAASIGGIWDVGGVMVSNCYIVSNYSASYSGGIYGGRIYDSWIIGNVADTSYGGGAAPGYMERCVVSGNVARTTGGGLYLNSTHRVINCDIKDNIASDGGGVYFTYGGAVYDSTLRNNIATNRGGAAYCIVGGRLQNCLVVDNAASNNGGGFLLDRIGNNYTGAVESCTLAGNTANTGGGIFIGGTNVWVTNTIVYGNTAWSSGPDIYAVGAQTNAFGYCCAGFANFAPGRMNLTSDPLFANAAAGDFQLAAGSPCINAGTNQPWMSGALDMGGRRRLDWGGGAVDMGCYEVVPPGTMIRLR